MPSIRRQTASRVALTLAVIVAAGGVGLWMVIRAALLSAFDDALVSQAAAIRAQTHSDRGTVELEVVGSGLSRYQPGLDADYFLAWLRHEDGWVPLSQSPSMTGRTWPVDAEALLRAGAPTPVGLPDGRAGRAVVVEFQPEEEDEARQAATPGGPAVPLVRVLVAHSTDGVQSTLAAIARSIVSVGVALLVVALIGTWWSVAAGLRPLATLGRRVRAIDVTSLDSRIEVADLPDELLPVTSRLNETLGRLHGAFQRERRFTAGAAHELRTPLTEVRLMLEAALGRERTPERWKETAAAAVSVTADAQRLLTSLLTLARGAAPAGHPADAPALTDLAAMVRAQLDHDAPAFAAADLPLDIQLPAHAHIACDESTARAVVRNLLENALRHADRDRDSRVTAGVEADGDSVALRVSNSAKPLTQADLACLFEPFWRRDKARPAGAGHGLGLPVCRTLMAGAHGEIDATLDDHGRLTVTARWPAPASQQLESKQPPAAQHTVNSSLFPPAHPGPSDAPSPALAHPAPAPPAAPAAQGPRAPAASSPPR